MGLIKTTIIRTKGILIILDFLVVNITDEMMRWWDGGGVEEIFFLLEHDYNNNNLNYNIN